VATHGPPFQDQKAIEGELGALPEQNSGVST